MVQVILQCNTHYVARRALKSKRKVRAPPARTPGNCEEAPVHRPERVSAIMQTISNMTDAATIAVIWFGLSLVGIKQTTSPPIIQ